MVTGTFTSTFLSWLSVMSWLSVANFNVSPAAATVASPGLTKRRHFNVCGATLVTRLAACVTSDVM